MSQRSFVSGAEADAAGLTNVHAKQVVVVCPLPLIYVLPVHFVQIGLSPEEESYLYPALHVKQCSTTTLHPVFAVPPLQVQSTASVGARVGAAVGAAVVGSAVGGAAVVGAAVVGASLVGAFVGASVAICTTLQAVSTAAVQFVATPVPTLSGHSNPSVTEQA